jgi:hypothetical protein
VNPHIDNFPWCVLAIRLFSLTPLFSAVMQSRMTRNHFSGLSGAVKRR